MRARTRLLAFFARLSRNERGATAVIVALSVTALLGVTGYVVDMGQVFWVQRELQASADLAALAGATYVATNPTIAVSTATAYSGLSGQKNAVEGVNSVTMVGGGPTLKCFTSIAPACGAGTYNGIVVAEQAVVPMSFLSLFGKRTITVSATATAGAKGGNGKALDVMVVLDTTQSMTQKDANCSIKNATKEQCAQAGAYALLQSLNPTLDKIGFMVFPGVTAAGVTSDTTCGDTLSSKQVVSYKAAAAGSGGATYQIAGLTNGFASNGKVNTSNAAVIAAGGGGSNCQGIQAVGGVGTYFSDAIYAAQSALASDGDTNQKVIVLLSDGDAGASSSNMPSGKAVDQCQQAVATAQGATKAGMWVYAVAYAASTSGCSTDTTNYTGVDVRGISPCATMKAIASDSTKFYSDGSGASGCVGTAGNSNDLVALFKSISSDLTGASPRLLPNDTT